MKKLFPFSKGTLLLTLIFTVLNVWYTLYFQEKTYFLIRQTVIFGFLSARDDLSIFTIEDQQIKKILITKYPIFRYYYTLFVLCFFLFLFVERYTRFNILYVVLYTLYTVLILLYICFILYEFVCILRTSELRTFYNVEDSIKSSGLYSVTTMCKIVHIFKLFLKLGFVICVLLWGIPKIIHLDLFYRGDFINTFSYYIYPHHLKSASIKDMMNANYLLKLYPRDKIFITKWDGIAICPSRLTLQMGLRKLPKITESQRYRIFDFWK